VLIVQPGIGVEGYRIDEEAGALQVTGNDPRGLLYGVGRLLHDGSFGPVGFTPGAWRGASAPDCSLRGMYLAHNFRNWWRSAPIGDTVRYLEELALWGLNTIIVPPGTNPPSPPDEVYGTLIPKQVELLKAARRLGIHVGMSAASYKNRRSLRSKYFRIECKESEHATSKSTAYRPGVAGHYPGSPGSDGRVTFDRRRPVLPGAYVFGPQAPIQPARSDT